MEMINGTSVNWTSTQMGHVLHQSPRMIKIQYTSPQGTEPTAKTPHSRHSTETRIHVGQVMQRINLTHILLDTTKGFRM